MRSLLVLCLVLAACDDPSQARPLDAKAMRPVDGPPPVPKPKPAVVAAATPSEPTDAELAGPWELQLTAKHEKSRWALWAHLSGDASAGQADLVEVGCGQCEGGGRYLKGTLSAVQLKVLRDELKRLRVWKMKDQSSTTALDRPSYEVSVKLGSVKRTLLVYAGCPCAAGEEPHFDLRGPFPVSSCACAEAELVALAERTASQLTPAERPATQIAAFKPAPKHHRQVKGSCVGPFSTGVYECGSNQVHPMEPGSKRVARVFEWLPWCRDLGKRRYSCFRDPFEADDTILTADAAPAKKDKPPPEPWAATLETGERCATEHWDWYCDQGTQPRLVLTGKSWTVIDQNGTPLNVATGWLR